jgi:predicted nucleic acid-binding Zn ribbon protein
MLWFWYQFTFGRGNHKQHTDGSPAPAKKHYCPVCGTELKLGEQIKSTTFSLQSSERIIYIRGCRYCVTGGVSRGCPVCHKQLQMDETLIARMSKTDVGNAVRILGCPQCVKGHFF